MPKRKSDVFLKKIQRKMRKLDHKLKEYNKRKASSSSESEDSSNDSTSSSSSSDIGDREYRATTQKTVEDIPPQQPGQEIAIPIDILGTNPLESAAVGPEIHAEIASRWTTFCRTGLDKDDRKSLIEKYPSPSNVESLSPPILNAEISACLTENLLKQDKFLSTLQKQIAAAMSAIALPMNVFFSNPSEEMNAHLQHLANGSKLLADVMHSLSRHRRYGLSNTMNNNIRKVVMDRPIEGFLFGEDLSNQIKTAQELKKVSAEIKIQSFPSTSGLGSRLPNKPSSGSRQTSDFLAKRFKFSHRKKAEGSRRNQKLKRSWKRSEYRN
nr:unnamed protein product [Callosobruchus analis]